jgi:hypothetical protein
MCNFKEEYKNEEYTRREAIVKENQKWLDEYKQGFWEGFGIGQTKVSFKTALKMLSDGIELNFISETTNLSIEEINDLKSQIHGN